MLGRPPIRARKARYFEDPRLARRILSPPTARAGPAKSKAGGDDHDWTGVAASPTPPPAPDKPDSQDDPNGGVRREPTLPEHEWIAPEPAPPPAHSEFAFVEDDQDDEAARARALRGRARTVARQAAMDPGDGIAL